MGSKSKVPWPEVNWALRDKEIAALYGCTAGHVNNKRREIFGPARFIRMHTYGVRILLTEDLDNAIRRSAEKNRLSFSEWMRRAAEMKLAEEARNG